MIPSQISLVVSSRAQGTDEPEGEYITLNYTPVIGFDEELPESIAYRQKKTPYRNNMQWIA